MSTHIIRISTPAKDNKNHPVKVQGTSIHAYGKGEEQYICIYCSDHFSDWVWHCICCNHHWPLTRDTCFNCHRVDFDRGSNLMKIESEDIPIDFHREHSFEVSREYR